MDILHVTFLYTSQTESAHTKITAQNICIKKSIWKIKISTRYILFYPLLFIFCCFEATKHIKNGNTKFSHGSCSEHYERKKCMIDDKEINIVLRDLFKCCLLEKKGQIRVTSHIGFLSFPFWLNIFHFSILCFCYSIIFGKDVKVFDVRSILRKY